MGHTRAFAGQVEERKCLQCESYYEEWEGEYGGWLADYGCTDKKAYGQLKSFPFKKKMPCFQIDFWHTRFTELVGEESFNKPEQCRGLYYFKLADLNGDLPPEIEVEFQKELAAHRGKHGDPKDW